MDNGLADFFPIVFEGSHSVRWDDDGVLFEGLLFILSGVGCGGGFDEFLGFHVVDVL